MTKTTSATANLVEQTNSQTCICPKNLHRISWLWCPKRRVSFLNHRQKWQRVKKWCTRCECLLQLIRDRRRRVESAECQEHHYHHHSVAGLHVYSWTNLSRTLSSIIISINRIERTVHLHSSHLLCCAMHQCDTTEIVFANSFHKLTILPFLSTQVKLILLFLKYTKVSVVFAHLFQYFF